MNTLLHKDGTYNAKLIQYIDIMDKLTKISNHELTLTLKYIKIAK